VLRVKSCETVFLTSYNGTSYSLFQTHFCCLETILGPIDRQTDRQTDESSMPIAHHNA